MRTGVRFREHNPYTVPNALRWLWLSGLVIVVDQASKLAIEVWRGGEPPLAVIPGLVNLVVVHNTGAAFSLLSSASGWQRWLFTGLALVIGAAIVFWLRKTPRRDWLTALPLALILGGAMGNVIDRLRLGYVVDFIDVYYRDWHWPAFNVADSAISVGVVLFLLGGFLSDRRRGRAGPA